MPANVDRKPYRPTAAKHGTSFHGILFLLAVGLVALVLPRPTWPSNLLLPVLAYAALVLPFKPLRRTAPAITAGRLTGAPFAYAVVIALSTAAVLISFHLLARPNVTALAARIPTASLGNLFLAGLLFSLLNAALEELIFRGILWAAIADEWNTTLATLITAVIFGLAHLQGYPPGPLGAALATLFGLALGHLRQQTGGLAFALACHITADATIFCLLLTSGAFSHNVA